MTEPKRPRHLIDPTKLGQPRPNAAAQQKSLEQVQRWVLSVLAVSTIFHLVGGLLVTSWFMDPDRVGARYGLGVIAALLGVVAVAAGIAIHKRPLATPWLLLGTIPAIVVTTIIMT